MTDAVIGLIVKEKMLKEIMYKVVIITREI